MKRKYLRHHIDMRRSAEEWADLEFVQQAVAQLPWAQTPLSLTSLKTRAERVRTGQP